MPSFYIALNSVLCTYLASTQFKGFSYVRASPAQTLTLNDKCLLCYHLVLPFMKDSFQIPSQPFFS